MLDYCTQIALWFFGLLPLLLAAVVCFLQTFLDTFTLNNQQIVCTG